MPVYDRSYRHWDGTLSRRALRFVPIASTGIAQALTYRGARILKILWRLLLLASLVPTLAFLFFNFLLYFRPAWAPPPLIQTLEQLEPYRTLQYPLLLLFNSQFILALTVLVGSGLVGRDRAAGAMPLYLSRPITRLDYALGKFCVLAWFLGALTIAPSLLLWICGVLWSPRPDAFARMAPELPRILVHGGVIIATYASTMLAVSALFRRPMFAGLVWFATFIFLPGFLAFASMRLGWERLPAIAPGTCFQVVAYDLWGIDQVAAHASGPAARTIQNFVQVLRGNFEVPVEWCWLSLAAWTLAGLLVLALVLRRQEVVTDAAR
jgi:ABC-type transport system involved in multi-copper enzyme maturation permease subunit